jgi:hypothetical protein
MAAKKTTKPAKKSVARKRQTVGESIIQGLKEAIAWTRAAADSELVFQNHKRHPILRRVRQR